MNFLQEFATGKTTMKIKRVKVTECSELLYRRFYSLNFRRDGMMRGALVMSRQRRYLDDIIHYIESEGKIICWSLLFNSGFNRSQYKIYFYVRKGNRKCGLAKKLFKATEKYCSEFNIIQTLVYPHDKISKSFFDKCASKSGRFHISKACL